MLRSAPRHRTARKPSLTRGFIQLMIIWGGLCTLAYLAVGWWA